MLTEQQYRELINRCDEIVMQRVELKKEEEDIFNKLRKHYIETVHEERKLEKGDTVQVVTIAVNGELVMSEPLWFDHYTMPTGCPTKESVQLVFRGVKANGEPSMKTVTHYNSLIERIIKK